MPTTFDRYLLRRYLHVFFILLISMYGLYVVIDGFTNIDEFQEVSDDPLVVVQTMGEYYLYQFSAFFDMLGAIISVTAVIVVFGLLQKNCEIAPILAAGVPTFRLVRPFLFGTIFVNGLIFANQELVIPKIAHVLQAERTSPGQSGKDVEPIYDYKTHIRIDGQKLFMADKRLAGANFVLPVPEVAVDLTTLNAEDATFHEATKDRAPGWHLRKVAPPFAELSLTTVGQRLVTPMENPEDVFVATDVSFDQLSNRNNSYEFVNTQELIRRIRNPAYGTASLRGQIIHLHSRLVTPIANVLCIFVAVPLILRKESQGLVTNMAICACVLGLIYGLTEAFLYCGRVNWLPADLAAWCSPILTGTLGAWLHDSTQT
jgi:lipopolysaccharide export system permease protein